MHWFLRHQIDSRCSNFLIMQLLQSTSCATPFTTASQPKILRREQACRVVVSEQVSFDQRGPAWQVSSECIAILPAADSAKSLGSERPAGIIAPCMPQAHNSRPSHLSRRWSLSPNTDKCSMHHEPRTCVNTTFQTLRQSSMVSTAYTGKLLAHCWLQ